MTIRSLLVTTFGGLAERTIEFDSGLNVILGDNESGKSTVYKAIEHTLLTPTSLDKRSLRRELGPYFPLPGGNSAECSITIETNGETTIHRRWGADALDEARLPEGPVVRGSDEVTHVVERLLPVSQATFRTILLCDQNGLDKTAELLRIQPGVRDEAADALRQARFGLGGVSPDLFLRTVEERLAELLGRWDLERDRPEKDRQYTDPWEKGAGSIVKAFYDVQETEARLTTLIHMESELDRVSGELESLRQKRQTLEVFLDDFQPAYDEFVAARGLETQIQTAESRLQLLRTANRRWPVVLEETDELRRALVSLENEKKNLETLRRESEERRRFLEVREKLTRIDRLFSELETARRALGDLLSVDDESLQTLRRIEAELPYAEAKLKTGSLRARLTVRKATEITSEVDGKPTSSNRISPEDPVELEASRHLVVDSGDLRLEVETGEESYAELRSVVDGLEHEQIRLLETLGATTSAEAEERRLCRSAAEKESLRIEEALFLELDVSDVPGAVSARAELETAAGAEGSTTDPESVQQLARTVPDLSANLEAVREQIGGANARLQHAVSELEALEEKYGSQDELEIVLTQARLEVSELARRRDGRDSVPGGFDSAEGFLSEYETRRKLLADLSREYDDQRVAYAELVGGQPDETSEELRETRDSVRFRFERLRRDAKTLVRVRDRATDILRELDSTVYDPFVEWVARYAGVLTGGRYVPVHQRDPLQPEEFRHSADAVNLPYALLSQGTRDSLALSIRLALAETALQSESAPLILDDPLVDMDPSRRATAAAAITSFAEHHQVVIFTCHPEHAALFPTTSQFLLD